MARSGITQAQVDAAADALLLAGERPTIERVRAHLGTGAPATVIRLMDIWWKALGVRLQAQALKVSMPEAPAEVAVMASQLWQVALTQAQDMMRREQEVARAALETARTALDAEREALQQRVEASERIAAEASLRRDAAEVRLGDLQRLLEQQTQQLQALQARCQDADNEMRSLRAKLEAAVEALADAQKRAAAERTALEAAHRTSEDRWLQEVDRARQECERIAGGLQKLEKEGAAARADAAAKLAKTSKALQHAERDEAVMASRIITLEAEIERLHGQLVEALRHTGAKLTGAFRKRRTSKAASAPRSRKRSDEI